MLLCAHNLILLFSACLNVQVRPLLSLALRHRVAPACARHHFDHTPAKPSTTPSIYPRSSPIRYLPQSRWHRDAMCATCLGCRWAAMRPRQRRRNDRSLREARARSVRDRRSERRTEVLECVLANKLLTEGVAREVAALYGERPPPVAIYEEQKLYRAKRQNTGPAKKW